jgi:hypothetical protein
MLLPELAYALPHQKMENIGLMLALIRMLGLWLAA